MTESSPLLPLIAFLLGVIAAILLIWYLEWRRYMQDEAWRRQNEAAAAPPHPGLVARLAGSPGIPPEASLAEEVDAVLQRLLDRAGSDLVGQLYITGRADGGTLIHLGDQTFTSVEEMPPGPAQDLIRQAVTLWNKRH